MLDLLQVVPDHLLPESKGCLDVQVGVDLDLQRDAVEDRRHQYGKRLESGLSLGIHIDRFRQPDKILAATERLVPLVVDYGVRQAAFSHAPIIVFWLHKGADSFMSESDFQTFYWPTLKAVMKGLIEQGLVPMMWAQGAYNKRLDAIVDDDLPAGSVIWVFDQTDMKAAKRALNGYACIGGNVPSALLALGSVAEVKRYVAELLDSCARDGGFFLRTGAALDDAKAENLKAMFDAGRSWRG